MKNNDGLNTTIIAVARYNLAVCFYCGRGATEDEDKAITWLRAAARQGHLPSMFNLALQTDDEEAMLLRAAQQGHTPSQLFLGSKKTKKYRSLRVTSLVASSLGDCLNGNGR
ncbi:hypothetical protein QOT17_010883 [Balamuthia mandrillaris]